MIHTGYIVNITPEVKEQISDILQNEVNCKSSPYTAIHFKEDENLMKSWFEKRKGKTEIGYIKGLYYNGKFLVGYMTIGPIHTWLYMSDEDTSPADIKRLVSSGKLGEMINIEKITVECTAYKYENLPNDSTTRRTGYRKGMFYT